MAKIRVAKTPNGNLEPIFDEDREALKSFAIGEEVQVTIRKPNNYEFHKKLYKLLHVAFENQDQYSDFEHFRTEIKLRCGWYEEHVTLKGNIVYVPKSLDFENMDHIEREKFYNKAIDVILENFIPMEKKELELEILDFS